MPGPSVLTSADLEHQELEALEAALTKTPRLVKLLSYLANSYFENAIDRLTEFNIATQVFGRNPETFIASEDAIARVETHRLRKKLKQFYGNEGKDHAVQISIPLGTYVPVFVYAKGKEILHAQSHSPIDSLNVEEFQECGPHVIVSGEENIPLEASLTDPTNSAESWLLRLSWQHALVIFILLGILGVLIAVRVKGSQASTAFSRNLFSLAGTRPPAGPGTGQSAGVTIPFRMIAGYSGPLQKDSEGFTWQPDQYYRRGWGLHHSAVYIPGVNDPLIFQYGRAGDMDYDIPLQAGSYELHLYFMQSAETALGEDAENKAISDVALNGKLILDNFDIVSDAMGRNIADERVFRDVSPASDGQLHLHLSTVVGTPSLSALAIFQGTPGKLLPIRIVTQPMPRTDHNGVLWRTDNYFIGGRHLSHNLPTLREADPDILTTERYGHFSYVLPVDPRDQYTVSLYFVELFFGTPESSGGGAGSRVFRVQCNGNTLLDHLDIFKEAGNFRVVKKTFYRIRPTAQGKLNLTFEPITNYATVSAIEVLDESN